MSGKTKSRPRSKKAAVTFDEARSVSWTIGRLLGYPKWYLGVAVVRDAQDGHAIEVRVEPGYRYMIDVTSLSGVRVRVVESKIARALSRKRSGRSQSVSRIEAILLVNEWVAIDAVLAFCPVCLEGEVAGHEPGCDVDRVLDELGYRTRSQRELARCMALTDTLTTRNASVNQDTRHRHPAKKTSRRRA